MYNTLRNEVKDMLETIKDWDLLTTTVRLSLALICGGVLGIERGRKKRPAGFRTYMLVCVGSALVMMTNQYIANIYGDIDVSRMGAQVISGIGFLGAGTIIVTGRNRVKGLTTAAGLWATACIGLAIGIGYYSGAVIGCFLILVIMSLLHILDERVMASTKVIDLYIEFEKLSDVGEFMEYIKENDMRISELEISRSNAVNENGIAVLFTLRLGKKRPHTEIIQILSKAVGVRYVEEV